MDEKKRARLNLISHLFKHIPYNGLKREKVKLPDRQRAHGYEDPTAYTSGAGTDIAIRVKRFRHGQSRRWLLPCLWVCSARPPCYPPPHPLGPRAG
jgi:hypothetical protein